MCIRKLKLQISRLDRDIAYCETHHYTYLQDDLQNERERLLEEISFLLKSKQGASTPNE